ncbi:MAG: hypothetical protein ACSHYB_19065 [Roseibacillus sp.]
MESSPPLTQNLWERFGFRGNPFDTNPLPLDYGSGLTVINAYIERSGKFPPGALLQNVLKNPGGGRLVVEGEPGVGKTTFVNYHRYQWEHLGSPGLLSPTTEISVTRGWTTRTFLISLLSALNARIRLELPQDKPDPLVEEVSAITSVQRSQDGGLGINATILGSGGGFNRSQTTALTPGEVPENELRSYLTRLITKVREDLKFDGVIFHLDNMERLRPNNPKELTQFFEDIRDLIQEPNAYFIFVGYPGMFQEVIAPASRVHSIFFDKPLLLEPLTRKEIDEVIELRYQILAAKDKNWTAPVGPDVIDYLYETFHGKVREIMNAVASLFTHLPDSYADPLTLTECRDSLSSIRLAEAKATLTKAGLEVFLEAARLKRFFPTQLARQTGRRPNAITNLLPELQKANYITKTEKEGRTQWYEVATKFHVLADLES